ncbi:MAG: glycosyltransferase [Clostridiales bacterium]|nr:glycosyltransferase [Clostridiales bacterium]
MNSTISVIMATYNCEKTVDKAIQSVLAQTYADWVMIICDDGSSDGTLEILKAYEQQYPGRFVILQNDGNRKLPYSLNHCLKYVKTDIVARMDGDDWSMPERFEKQIEYLRAHPDVDLVGTGIVVSDGENTLTTIVQPKEPKPEDMLASNCFSHATIMTYKRVYDALGGYSLDPTVERCEDLDLWSRFFVEGFVGHNLPDKLYAILEDENAVHRRDLKNRINTAKTLSAAYKRMGLKGFRCFKKAYFQVLTYFLPMCIYKKLHVWKMSQRTRSNCEKNE